MNCLRFASSARPLARGQFHALGLNSARFAGQTRHGFRRYTTETPKSPPKQSIVEYLRDPKVVKYVFSVIAISLGIELIAVYYHGPQHVSPLRPDEFQLFKLKEIIPYNHNTSKFVFELPWYRTAKVPITSCAVVRAANPSELLNEKHEPVIRPYTPIETDTKGRLVLLVKKYENGNASKHIHSLKPGDSLAIKGPIEKFPYKSHEFEEVALIGGGSGITPLHQIITHALSNPLNTTKFTLLYANVAEEDILLREDFDALQKKHPSHFKVVYALDKPPAGWTGATGFISQDLIKEHVAPASLAEKVKVFICGPPGQVSAVAGKKKGMKQGELGGILKELGYKEDQVYKF